MSGTVVDPSLEPPDYEDTGGEYLPPAGSTYYILSKNDVEQPFPEYENWELANFAAQNMNNGYDQIDKNQWDVVEKVKPA